MNKEGVVGVDEQKRLGSVTRCWRMMSMDGRSVGHGRQDSHVPAPSVSASAREAPLTCRADMRQKFIYSSPCSAPGRDFDPL